MRKIPSYEIWILSALDNGKYQTSLSFTSSRCTIILYIFYLGIQLEITPAVVTLWGARLFGWGAGARHPKSMS